MDDVITITFTLKNLFALTMGAAEGSCIWVMLLRRNNYDTIHFDYDRDHLPYGCRLETMGGIVPFTKMVFTGGTKYEVKRKADCWLAREKLKATVLLIALLVFSSWGKAQFS